MKNLDRMGRDYLRVGLYRELFRKKGVRLISIGDNYDSATGVDDDFTPFKEIIHEWYARDCSRKVKAVLQAKGNSGVPLVSYPIFGYKRHPDDKKVWIIDDEAAAIVRRIFQMTIDGSSPRQISRTLHEEKDWKIFENRHPAIVSQEEFDLVQKLRKTPRRTDKNHAPNPLTGLIFCYDCKAKMYNTRRYTNAKGSTKDSYDCSTYTLSRDKFVERCSGHFIRTEVIRELVLDSIRNICGYVRKNQTKFVEQIREESTLQRGETAKSYKKLIAKNERRIAELDKLFRRVYEDNVNGKLSDERFKQMSAEYEREQAELKTKNSEMQAELDKFNADSEKTDDFIKLVKKYTEFEELTTPMLNEFVAQIFVHKATKNEWGEREQQVDIHFNFIGEFKPPTEEVEPTAEELEALEKQRINRAKHREYEKRYREKQKAKKSAK